MTTNSRLLRRQLLRPLVQPLLEVGALHTCLIAALQLLQRRRVQLAGTPSLQQSEQRGAELSHLRGGPRHGVRWGERLE